VSVTGVAGPELGMRRFGRTGRRARDFVGRALRRTDGLVGAAILAFFAVLAIAPGLFVGPLETVITASGKSLDPPSAAHLLGTDNQGRDMINLTVHGARISMLIGLMATLITIVVGALVGILAGYIGGWLDTILMRLSDFFLEIGRASCRERV